MCSRNSIDKGFVTIIWLLLLSVIFGCQNECAHEGAEKNIDCEKDFKVGAADAREIADRLAIENDRDPEIYDVSIKVSECDYILFYDAKSDSWITGRGDPRHFTIYVSGLNGETRLIKGQ